MTVVKKMEKQVVVRLWETFNTGLMSLTVNLWAKGSHDTIRTFFHESELGSV